MTYAMQIAERYNATLREKRDGIEWAVGPGEQLYLREKPGWTASHSEHLARTAEDERKRWARKQPLGDYDDR